MDNTPDQVVEGDEGNILFKGSLGEVRELKDTTFADGHAPKTQLRKEIESTGEDLGEGFVMQDVPVFVQRDATGGIARLTPLNELPGVQYTQEGLRFDEKPEVAEEKPTPVTLGRDERRKLIDILTMRLFKYYRNQPGTVANYNPFRDGLPDLPSGAPEHLQPLPGTPLYPATDYQIYQWLRKFVADRTSVIEKRRFGKGHLSDLALRIE